jgi:hypothetical protein
MVGVEERLGFIICILDGAKLPLSFLDPSHFSGFGALPGFAVTRPTSEYIIVSRKNRSELMAFEWKGVKRKTNYFFGGVAFLLFKKLARVSSSLSRPTTNNNNKNI